MDGPADLCCDFGRDTHRPYKTPPPHAYTDWLGFTYRLCDKHYRAFVLGMERVRLASKEGGRFSRDRGVVLRRILALETEADAPPGR